MQYSILNEELQRLKKKHKDLSDIERQNEKWMLVEIESLSNKLKAIEAISRSTTFDSSTKYNPTLKP